MFFRPFALVIDVRHRAHGDPEDAIGRRRNSPGLHLAAASRKIQKRRRVIVPSTDDERDLVALLQIVEFFGKLGKLYRASKPRPFLARDSRPCICSRAAEVPRPVIAEIPDSISGSVSPFAGSSFGIT